MAAWYEIHPKVSWAAIGGALNVLFQIEMARHGLWNPTPPEVAAESLLVAAIFGYAASPPSPEVPTLPLGVATVDLGPPPPSQPVAEQDTAEAPVDPSLASAQDRYDTAKADLIALGITPE